MTFWWSEKKYNEIADAAANAVQRVRVHYENNSPFLVVEQLEREVEISHWGNVAITDKIWLKHAGAQLKVIVTSQTISAVI